MVRKLTPWAALAALVLAGCGSKDADEAKGMNLDAPVSTHKISKQEAAAARGDSPEDMAKMDEHHGNASGR